MDLDATPPPVQRRRRFVLQATFVALIAGCGAPIDAARASAPVADGSMAQSTNDDPCRFATAAAVGKAFGRAMSSSKLANVCQYRGAGTDMVVVKVATGPEGTILRHERSASAQPNQGAEKVPTPSGEAFFDSVLPVFIGRVGNYEVQIETTIQPAPRDAMIAVGKSIMQGLAGK